MNNKIMGGYFIIARQIFDSKIWQDKPSSWKIIWIYILGKVNHTNNNKFKRGEGFFNFKREIKDIGCDISYDTIKKCLRFVRDSEMVSTSRSTRGIIIKVLKFDKYQDPSNYQAPVQAPTKAPEKHQRSTPIHKNDKNDKNIILGIKNSPITYKWQDDAFKAINFFKDGKVYKTRILKAFKDNEQKANIAFNDCKELERKNTMYFFAVFNKLNK